jgi:NAD dependent epimerase/dehydratase family enzyme
MHDTHQKIILAGGSGFLGQSLARHFAAKGCDVVVFSRRPAPDSSSIRRVLWDGRVLGDWARELDGAHAVINLTGRSVDCRYNAANRQEILHSRLDATRVLGEAIHGCAKRPTVWLNAASATIYADTRGDTPANDEEQGVIGEGFSVDVCRAWEKTFWDAEVPGLRKVLMRIAIVLGEAGAMVMTSYVWWIISSKTRARRAPTTLPAPSPCPTRYSCAACVRPWEGPSVFPHLAGSSSWVHGSFGRKPNSS